MAQPSVARVTFRLTESEAAKFGLLGRWQAAFKRRKERELRKAQTQTLLAACVHQLLAKAQREEWSQRQLAGKIAIPETTFRRIRAQRVDPFVWLPKLEAALKLLNPS